MEEAAAKVICEKCGEIHPEGECAKVYKIGEASKHFCPICYTEQQEQIRMEANG